MRACANMGVRATQGFVRDMWGKGEGRASSLTGLEMGMQVISSKDVEIDELKKRLKEATDIIAGLKKELEEAKAALTAKDAQITELQAHLSKLDEELAPEFAKEHALAKQLVEEQRKEEELEANRNKTKVCFRGELKGLISVCSM